MELIYLAVTLSCVVVIGVALYIALGRKKEQKGVIESIGSVDPVVTERNFEPWVPARFTSNGFVSGRVYPPIYERTRPRTVIVEDEPSVLSFPSDPLSPMLPEDRFTGFGGGDSGGGGATASWEPDLAPSPSCDADTSYSSSSSDCSSFDCSSSSDSGSSCDAGSF